ncbi:glycoside hydrolase family 130 protein [Aestuariibacter sp. A3R04]|uniref:glycoside hydrolase family 130 protein n=1 Tax=Aestuariibacter sp. A3R04 TaxID=2841571 RepID=UPI001C08C532|nr:glycoside hydrolase family 130 protein [Aestuariibacter sp. A3R04]MBU3023638.1 glycoside hydrolase family 130 protein [Aestuariibacter sp. A3R04]
MNSVNTSEIPKHELSIKRRKWKLHPDPSLVICRPHIPSGGPSRIQAIINRVLGLSKQDANKLLDRLRLDFSERHRDLNSILDANFKLVEPYAPSNLTLSANQKMLLGAYFTMEYAVSSAALFNPSIVRHPDQSNLGPHELRFVMSLRAVGEGHISSLCFRSGIIKEDGSILFDPVSDIVEMPLQKNETLFDKATFFQRVYSFTPEKKALNDLLNRLPERFTLREIDNAVVDMLSRNVGDEYGQCLHTVQLVAHANYEINFHKTRSISERVIFPLSPSEVAGIEDARFVEFNDENQQTYYATYTAYDGHNILPQLMETRDFSHFKISTFSGNAAQNKGMALFPRKVNGKYAMLGRLDGENNYIMYSDTLSHWGNATLVQTPEQPWEFIQLGNCGSPIETEAGWLVLTHGVGPMREYSIGAVLLDLDDPRRVIAKLSHPLLRPHEQEREGYVPNVVYSCGALVHRNELILPYAMSDISSGLVSVNVKELLESMDKI